jgi:hypothetical protein
LTKKPHQASELLAGGANVAAALERHFGRPDALNNVFVASQATENDSGLDLDALDAFYAKLSPPQVEGLLRVMERMCRALPGLRATKFFETRRGLRLFDVVLQMPTIEEPSYHQRVVTPVLEAVAALDDAARARLARYWSRLGKVRMQRRLALFHQVITMRMLLPPPVADLNSEVSIVGSARAMACLHAANNLLGDEAPIKFGDFYNETLNEQLDLVEDFVKWLNKSQFSFCLTPFLLNCANKAEILKFESQLKKQQQQRQAMQDAMRNAVFGGGMLGFNPFLVFGVRRDHLIEDTLENIVRHDSDDLKKELKIKFAGEDGVDAGGVQKEFFQLIVRDIFNPDFGMFVMDKDTRSYWFSPLSQEFREFELIGTILGLAIYNGVILDVHFPHVVYKKLMGRRAVLADLAQVSPELSRGMQTLLAFDGDVESVYARNFQVEVDNYGQKDFVDLKPNGGNIALTNANREEFVELFVDYQLNKCIAKQYAAFKKGFDLVVNGPAFAIFTPQELELLVCGEPTLDFEELAKAAKYESEDFGPEHQVVRWFWEVVHALPEDQKKKLLHFATGSDRAPIGGLKNLSLVIQRSGGDGDDRLPSSHTCFNHLLLPNYSTKEILAARLAIALDNSTGFGLR